MPSETDRIRTLFIQMVKAAGLRKSKPTMRVDNQQWGVQDEGGYVPGMWAEPNSKASPRSGTFVVNANPAAQRGNGQYENFGAAHELGHLGETQYVGNRARADMYTDAAGFNRDPRALYLAPSMAGRSEMRLTSPQRSRNGLPTEGGMGGGRASTHTTPVEQYATDFAQALGGYARLNHQDVSSMTPSKRRRLAKMQEMRLLPQRTLRRGLP